MGKLEIYVPSSRHPNLKEVTYEIKETFSSMFGGYTVQDVTGGWVNRRGELVEEPIQIIYIYHGETEFILEELMESLALNVKEKLQQEAVMIVIDGKQEFI